MQWHKGFDCCSLEMMSWGVFVELPVYLLMFGVSDDVGFFRQMFTWKMREVWHYKPLGINWWFVVRSS